MYREGSRAPNPFNALSSFRTGQTAGDPLKAVDILPGVSRSADGEPVLRGAAQHESAVFIDGTSVPFLYHFGGLRSVVLDSTYPPEVKTYEQFPQEPHEVVIQLPPKRDAGDAAAAAAASARTEMSRQ